MARGLKHRLARRGQICALAGARQGERNTVKRYLRALGIVALIGLIQACKVEVVEGDAKMDGTKSTPTDNTTTAEPTARGPSGMQLTNKVKAGTGFTSPEFTEGPELDQSKAALRALQEADIVQVAGNRLYTMSTAAGLSVIDLTAPDSLTLIGQYKLTATPFEMFVRGNTVIALLRDVPAEPAATTTATGTGGTAATIATDDDEDARYSRTTTSRIVALDATNPNAIRELSGVNVPGSISEGRILSNILYVASYEDLGCYSCNPTPTTTVVSLDVTDPAALRQVDREQFAEVQTSDGWSKHSVEINDNRMYISGFAAAGTTTTTTGVGGAVNTIDTASTTNSIIQVIDIADTTGNMQLGATVPVQGAIFSRWQMDEHLGILRVISQPSDWETQSPVVQTFTITNSSTITPLGRTTLTIPSGEKLYSVRFDGTRAFAITYVRTDPLFAIDLSDPASPRQVGELQIPGFVYHMEIRNDRIYALGFEVGNTTGGMHVSLFDVANLAAPRMLRRVNFGPIWSSNSALTIDRYLPENENRIHQVFKVLDDLGMILVPYNGWSERNAGCGTYQSAVQIVDFTRDDLVLRGAAPTEGAIRRALIHGERLIGVSEQHVDSFNLADRNTPTRVAHLPLTFRAHRTIPIGNRVMRVRADYWTHVAEADIVDLANVESNVSAGTLNLAGQIHTDTTSCQYHDDTPFMRAPVFAFGANHAALVVVRPDTADPTLNVTELLVLDVSGAVPAVASRLTLDFEPIDTGLGSGVAKIGETLVIQRPGDTIVGNSQDIALEVIDMTDPAHPRQGTPMVRPAVWGTTGLFAEGTSAASGNYTVGADERVNYFVDNVSFAAPAAPVAVAPLSVPGLLLGRAGENYVTVNFLWAPDATKDQTTCANSGGDYETTTRTCWMPTRPLSLVSGAGGTATTLSSGRIDSGLEIFAALNGQNRVFLPATNSDEEKAVFVIGFDNDQLVTSTAAASYQFESPVVRGTDLYYLDYYRLRRVDASSAASAVVRDVTTLNGREPNHLSISGNTALISFPDSGIQAVTLP